MVQSIAQETGESVTVTDPQSVLGRAAIAMCEVAGGKDWQDYVLMAIAALNVAANHIRDEAETNRSLIAEANPIYDRLAQAEMQAVMNVMHAAAEAVEPQLQRGYRANTAKTLEEAHHLHGTPWQERAER